MWLVSVSLERLMCHKKWCLFVFDKEKKMGVLLKLFLVTILVPYVFCQEAGDCFGSGSVAGAAIGGFLAALLLVAAAYYLRKLYWKSRKGKYWRAVITLLFLSFLFEMPAACWDETWPTSWTSILKVALTFRVVWNMFKIAIKIPLLFKLNHLPH